MHFPCNLRLCTLQSAEPCFERNASKLQNPCKWELQTKNGLIQAAESEIDLGIELHRLDFRHRTSWHRSQARCSSLCDSAESGTSFFRTKCKQISIIFWISANEKELQTKNAFIEAGANETDHGHQDHTREPRGVREARFWVSAPGKTNLQCRLEHTNFSFLCLATQSCWKWRQTTAGSISFQNVLKENICSFHNVRDLFISEIFCMYSFQYVGRGINMQWRPRGSLWSINQTFWSTDYGLHYNYTLGVKPPTSWRNT